MPKSFKDSNPDAIVPRSKVIAFVNQKGGVGKTTTSYNIACVKALSELTLLIDLDPQYTLTSNCHMKHDDPSYKGMDVVKMFEENIDPFSCCFSVDVLNDKTDKLYLIPSTQRLAVTCEEIVKNPELMYVFRENIKKLSQVFLTIIIDVGPTLDRLLTSCLISATDVVIPVLPDDTSSESLDIIIPTINEVKEEGINKASNKNLKVAGLIVNLYRSTVGEHNDTLKDLREHYNVLGVIPQAAIITKERSKGLPVVYAHPSSGPAKLFKEIAANI